jgi:hypothetical protein
MLRVLYRPVKGVVCYLLPSVLPHRVVGAIKELPILSDRLGVAVVPDVGLVDRWRHEVVFSTRYEQQRCPVFVPEVDVNVLVTGSEVGQGPGPHEAARRWDVVALVDLVRLLPAEGVGEGLVELLWGEADRPVAVGGVLQNREEGSYL